MLTQLLVLVFLLLINSFFAASEIALISLNDTKLKLAAESGDKKSLQLQKLLKEPSRFLATIQIGITLAGFLASAYAAESFSTKLVFFLQSMGISISEAILKGLSVAFITLILAYFTLVLGELVPKRLAMQWPGKISNFSVGPLTFLAIVTSPFVRLLTFSTNLIVNAFGGSTEATGENITEEEIRMMVDVGEENGTIEQIEREIINNVFDFDDKVASDIMTHRTQIVGAPLDSNLDDLLILIANEGYTRIPIFDGSLDNIIGILHIKDLLRLIGKEEDFELEKLLRKPYHVHESKKLSVLFRDLQKNKTHIVVVIDEYGGTAGIITIEDLLEQLVGNIFDEYDELEKDYEKVDENSFLFDGSINLDVVEDLFEVGLPIENFETLSGFIIDQLGRIPHNDEKIIVSANNLTFKIEDVDQKKIKKVLVSKNILEIILE